MLLHLGGKKTLVQALLDTGCSIALISKETVERLGLEKLKHKQTRGIESYTGENVKGAGQFYTKPMTLQHRKHYSTMSFEISPMEQNIDVFLLFN